MSGSLRESHGSSRYTPAMSSPVRAVPREFLTRVIEIVRERFPLVKIDAGDEAFSLSVNGSVAPLENLYRVDGAASGRPQASRRALGGRAAPRGGRQRRTRAATFDEVKDRILPMIVGGDDGRWRRQGVVTQPLVEGCTSRTRSTTIGRSPTSRRRSSRRGTCRSRRLHETAIENLVARSEAISAHAAQDEDGKVNLILFQTMDGYDASRVLLPTLHDRLREHLGSPFAAGIPNRDILLCFRDDDGDGFAAGEPDRRGLPPHAAPGDGQAAAGHARTAIAPAAMKFGICISSIEQRVEPTRRRRVGIIIEENAQLLLQGHA